MLKTIFSKVVWAGRAASTVFGLALVFALIFGVATAAFGANGDFFKVGKSNTASAVSKLIKQGAGPALELRVDSGAPLKVNSETKVAKLNSDKLDGQDSTAFMPFTTYQREILTSGQGEANAPNSAELTCDAGDKLLSGGVEDVDDDTVILDNVPDDETTWGVSWISEDIADEIGIAVLCADVQ